uniref:Uncharacterized protein n=1 Tax=Tanacetum cinerariifolium TaxID=118510 RepID=A0A6L2KRD1_TANCI|nr:hypothetical protein [Tanacetum cinerariifolium]
MKKTPIISSSKHYLHHHLKPHHKPLTTTTTTITPPDDLITKLTTTDDWTNLHHQITSLPQQSILKIAKQFTTSSKAFKFFNFINNPSSPTSSFVFQTVLQLATREKDPIFIDNLYKFSKDLNVSLTPMSAIIIMKHLFRVKTVQECAKLYDGLNPDGKTVDLCRSFRNDKAWELMRDLMKFGKVEAAPCNALLSGLGKERNYERINLLLKEMKENGIKPDIVTFGMLVNHLCKARRVDDALDMFKKMKEGAEGIAVKPDVILYNTLIDGLCKVGRQEEGLELMKQMMLDDSCVPSVVTYNCLIDGFCKSGEIERGQELFDQMSENGVDQNVITVNTLVDGMCKHGRIAGRPDDASVIASKLKKAGFRMDLATYNTLIGGFCRRKKLEKAVELLKEMEETGVKADGVTYNTLISYFSKNGDFESAYKFLKQMIIDGHVPTVITYSTLIHAYCLAGNLDEALNIYEEMLISSKRGVRPNTTTYNAMFKGLSSQNKLRIALRLMDQMASQSCNPDYVTMEILNDWLSAVGETEKLRKFVQGYQVS